MDRFIKRYNSLSKPLKASFWYLICNFFQKVTAVIFTPIFTRILSTGEYGHYGIYNSWEMIISVFVTLNLSYGVFTQGMIKNYKDKNTFSASFQGLTFFMLVLWLFIYILFNDFFHTLTGLSAKEILVMLVTSWVIAAYGLWAAEQRIEYKYRTLIITTSLSSFLGPILGILFVELFNDKVFGRILATLLVNLIVFFLPICSQFFNGGKIFCFKYWRYAFFFNIPLIPHYLSQNILSNSDRIMIEDIVGSSEAGIYNLAYSIAMVTAFFNSALLQTIHPWLYQKIKENNISTIKTVVYPSFIAIAFVNLFLIFFAPEAVAIFAPSQYYEAIWVIPPVAMSSLFNYSYGLFADFEFYYDKPYLATIASVGGAILNIFLNIVFIKSFGYVAAAYTTLICYILFSLLHYFFMTKICEKYMNNCNPYNTHTLFLGAIIFLAFGFSIMITYKYPLIRYSIIGICVVIIFIFRRAILGYIQAFLAMRKGEKL